MLDYQISGYLHKFLVVSFYARHTHICMYRIPCKDISSIVLKDMLIFPVCSATFYAYFLQNHMPNMPANHLLSVQTCLSEFITLI